MHQNWISLHAICKEMNEIMVSGIFVDAYSNGVDELVLVFELEKSHYAIKCLFLEGAMYFVFLTEVPNPGSKALHWFQSMKGSKVKKFKPHGLDRSFRIEMEHGETLVFKLYGRMSNVLFYKEKARPMEVFRTMHKNDLDLKLSQFPMEMNFNMTFNNKDEFAVNNKYLPKALVELTFESYERGSLEEYIKGQIQEFSKSWGLVSTQSGFELDVLESSYSSILEACNELVKQHFPVYVFANAKGKLIQDKTKEFKALDKQIKALSVNREKLKNRKSSKEIADIIMANLHAIKKGESKVELFDFYENKEIVVKLNKNLSPQDNATKYYKKFKSSGNEVEELDKKYTQLTKRFEKVKLELETIEDIHDFKTLKPFIKKESKMDKVKQKSSPYWAFDVEGIELWVGKSAKANDELLRLTSKNDWWLHAKDVAGSHCIVKQDLEALPNSLLEKIAAITAYYSKAKNQSLVPVIYTKRKFVRKPKGFPPGKVIVEKENVVLVEPQRPSA